MVIERKIRLDGTVVEVECLPIKVSHDFVVLRYDLPRAYEIDGVQLGVDCTTCACYWRGRPYNLYIFLRKEDSQPLGYYYNLIGASDWDEDLLWYEDWAVDLFIHPDGRCTVLDSEELPAEFPHEQRLVMEQTLHLLKEKGLELGTEIFAKEWRFE